MQEDIITNYLQNHFPSENALKITKAFKAMGIEKILLKSIQIFEQEPSRKDHIIFISLITGLLVNINYKIEASTSSENNEIVLNFLTKLIEYWLMILVTQHSEGVEYLLTSLEKAIHIANMQVEPSYSIQFFFNFDVIREHTTTFKPSKFFKKRILKNEELRQRYIWNQDSCYLELLNQHLYSQHFLKNRKDFMTLFSQVRRKPKVQWNTEKVPHLAHLLKRLFTENYIRITGNKGYFTYAEKHFVTFNKKAIPNNTLKKTSSHITMFPKEHETVIIEVENLLKTLTPYN